MTTVVDPLGTPAPVYNRSGVTLVTVAGNGTTYGSATAIPHESGHTIALLTTTDTDYAFKLPAVADIGDRVEVFRRTYPFVTDERPLIFPESGDTIEDGERTDVNVGAVMVFLKVTANDWVIFF